jgi:hypothetical protein
MDQQQQHDDEPEGQQDPPAAIHPEMSMQLFRACVIGDVGEIISCLDGGESINCVGHGGRTHHDSYKAWKVGRRPVIG